MMKLKKALAFLCAFCLTLAIVPITGNAVMPLDAVVEDETASDTIAIEIETKKLTLDELEAMDYIVPIEINLTSNSGFKTAAFGTILDDRCRFESVSIGSIQWQNFLFNTETGLCASNTKSTCHETGTIAILWVEVPRTVSGGEVFPISYATEREGGGIINWENEDGAALDVLWTNGSIEIVMPETTTTTTSSTTTTPSTTQPSTSTTTTTTSTSTTTTTTTTQSFTWGKDNWNFNNTKSVFGNNYYVTDSVMDKLTEKYPLDFTDQEAIHSYCVEKTWSGSCHGMVVTELLAESGILDIREFDGGDTVNASAPNESILSLINFYQASNQTSKFRQKIRNQLFTGNNANQQAWMQALIQNVEKIKSGGPLIYVAYAKGGYIPSTGEYLKDPPAHAVIAYGIEDYDYTFTDRNQIEHTYTKRILIADPNRSSKNSCADDACIYYNPEDYSWVIPYWNNQPKTSKTEGEYIGYSYWNASDQGTDHEISLGYIYAIYAYEDNEPTQLYGNTDNNQYIAGLSVNNISGNAYSVNEAGGNPHYAYSGIGDAIRRYTYAEADEETSEEIYALWNPTSNYILSYDQPSSYDIYMDYEDINYYVSAENSTDTSFKSSGVIELKGADASYDIAIVTNASACVTDWYRMEVSGNKADSISCSLDSNGYVLEGNYLHDITVTAYGTDGTASVTFSTDDQAVFLYEMDNAILGVAVDKDGNGSYETTIATSAMLGDVNGDNVVTLADVISFQKWLLNNGTKLNNPQTGDLNKDGKINIYDLILLKRKIIYG